MDDYLTGIDRTIQYLDPQNTTEGPRLKRLLECLAKGRYFLVSDGIERLLRESKNPFIGTASSARVEEFLNALLSKRSKSTVILTSRLWPETLGDIKSPKDRVKRCEILRLSPYDLLTDPILDSFLPKNVPDFVHSWTGIPMCFC